MSRRSILLSLVVFLLASLNLADAQNQPVNDRQAVKLAAQSITVLTGGANISDAILTGNATWLVGRDQRPVGATLIAKGTTESRVEIKLSGGSRVEIRSSRGRGPQGKWSNPDGSSGAYAQHNCWTDAAWFFPALTSLAKFNDPNFIFSYLGKESWNGLDTLHLRIHETSKSFRELSRLSTMDFYLDSLTLLPLGFVFKTHADKDMNTNISGEVRFADYRRVEGVQVPFRLQRLQGGVLLLDMVVTGVTFNSGVSDEPFSIQ